MLTTLPRTLLSAMLAVTAPLAIVATSAAPLHAATAAHTAADPRG